MGFYSGSSTMPGIVNMLADRLIASDSKFTNPYAASNRYTGDGNDADYGVSCYHRRVVKWEDPAKTGQERMMYTVFQIPFWDVNQAMFQTRGDSAQYMFGIEVIVSTAWNDTTNLPDGDVQRTIIPIAWWNTGMSNAQKAVLFTHNVAYWFWVDDDELSPDKGNGLCIMIKPDSTGGYGWSSWTYTTSVFFNMEKLKTKEFSDGYSLWFFHSHANSFPWGGGNQNALSKKWAWVLHPWAPPATDSAFGDANNFSSLAQTWWGQRSTGLNTFENYGIKGIDFPIWAPLSQGGSPPNVYFMKGIIHAEPRFNNKPIGIIEHCFPWREGTGIVDQDIISLPAPSTTKYVCLGKESATYAARLTMAMKYTY